MGIRSERFEKGASQQNGGHERKHRTLKAEATRPPSATMAAQQARFAEWRQAFTYRRPRDALHGATRASHCTLSPRPFPTTLPLVEYPAHLDLRRVSSNGRIKWRAESLFLSGVLADEYVSLAETLRTANGRLPSGR